MNHFALNQANTNLKSLLIDVGWDFDPKASVNDIDLDLSVFLLTEQGLVAKDEDFIFYNNLKPEGSGIEHLGDKGRGDGKGESLYINLDSIPYHASKAAFCVSLHNGQDRDQDLTVLQRLYMRVINRDADEEVVAFECGLNDAVDKTAVVALFLVRNGAEWVFQPVEEFYTGELYEVCRRFGVHV